MRTGSKITALWSFTTFLIIAGSSPAATGVEELYRLDLAPRLKQSVAVASISSYDRKGGNDDGFSGKYSYVRKEGDGLVIADLQGPGIIYRIWTPTPTDDITEFYFDGEDTPRIRLPFRQLFTGEKAPFLSPISGFGGGGFYSYVPLSYKRSCKVVVRAKKVRFYQINYATYPASADIETYPGPDSQEFREGLGRARRLFAMTGSDISKNVVPPGTELHSYSSTVKLEPGVPATVFHIDKPGRLAGIRMSPARAFAGKDRNVVLRIYWDGESEPAVLSPAGDFFGYAWGEPAMRSLLAGTDGETDYVYFPMPFDSSARIELEAEGAAPRQEIHTEVLFADVPRLPDEGKFHAIWRRENPTTAGKPFTFLEATGRGHLVGVILQAQGLESGRTPFFEGDDQTTVDGKLVVNGTGSEDFFNGGWYNAPDRWDGRISLPVSGALDYNNPLARTGGYRLFITDAYAFRRGILQTIEHGPTGNRVPTDYAAVTFFYAGDGITYDRTLPPLDARRVRDLDRIVFQPGWNVPISSFSLHNATLEKKAEKPGEGGVFRYLAMRAKGEDRFGPHHLALRCDLPAAGRYKVSIEAVEGPSAAIVQLFRNEKAIGAAADLFSAERKPGSAVPLGEFDFQRGPNDVFFKLTGKNPQSTGLDFDLIRIVFDRVLRTENVE